MCWSGCRSAAAKRPDFAIAYEELATEGDPSPLGIPRSGDDLLFLYTGGTTGMPKGVMWSHEIWRRAGMEGAEAQGLPVPSNMDEQVMAAQALGRHVRNIPACPLMHGTGLFTAMGSMMGGGTIVTLTENKRFNPQNLFETVEREGVTNMAIVGDAFGKPMLAYLDANPGKHKLDSVVGIISSGVMWSTEVKRGLLRHMPNAAMTDSFGASEAVGFGTSIMTADGEVKTSKFTIGSKCKVFTEDGREVVPGSGEAGFIARGGAVPLGYYKDPEKSEKTFQDHQWRALFRAWRLVHGGIGRHHHAAGPRLQLHQHRRGKGLPRRGRGSPESAQRREGRPCRGRAG